MEHKNATHALAALGHATRLSIFRLLVQAGGAGKLAGDMKQKGNIWMLWPKGVALPAPAR